MIWLHVWSKLRCRPTIICFCCNCVLPKFWMETLSDSSALAWGRRLSRALALTEYSKNPRGTLSRRGTSAVRSRTWVQEEYASLQEVCPKQNVTDSPMHRSRGRSVHLLHESSEDVVLHRLINALLGRAEVVQHDLAHLVMRNTTPTIGYSAKIWTNELFLNWDNNKNDYFLSFAYFITKSISLLAMTTLTGGSADDWRPWCDSTVALHAFFKSSGKM